MASCIKDTEIQVLGPENTLVKGIKFSNAKTQVILFRISDGSELCSNGIDSSAFLGIELVNDKLVFTNEISGLSTCKSFSLSTNPLVLLLKTDSTLHIIGIQDSEVSFVVPKMNVRYDAASNSIKFQI